MIIAVGSKNKAKIIAVKKAVKKIWPKVEIISLDVPSGVSKMPQSDDEAIEGAINRAKEAQRITKADFGLGLEGSVNKTKYGMFLCGWVAVVDKSGKINIASSSHLLLPQKIANEINQGKELGPLMDELTGKKDTKQKEGAVGVLTNNLVSRSDSFEGAIIFAFAKFFNNYYK